MANNQRNVGKSSGIETTGAPEAPAERRKLVSLYTLAVSGPACVATCYA